MQIAAHYSAAIEILDDILRGTPAEKALLAWSRGARYAGSKDRANVRDIVFDCLRRRTSFAARFELTGRGLALGRAHFEGELAEFSGEGFAPTALSAEEQLQADAKIEPRTCSEATDLPDGFCEMLKTQFGADFAEIAEAMRARAPVDLRVNTLKTTRKEAAAQLAREHIFTEELQDEDALRITLNPRRLNQSRAYNYGLVELQDISSQLVAKMAEAKSGERVLDYCAGGGGKTLALGAHMKGKGQLDAWDLNPMRMNNLSERALRAGVKVNILNEKPSTEYDLVFVDAPCSGSGAWRRTADAKWRLTMSRLVELVENQAQILNEVVARVAKDGRILYATCSLFAEENNKQIEAFLSRHKDYKLIEERQFTPIYEGDGFYGALLQKV